MCDAYSASSGYELLQSLISVVGDASDDDDGDDGVAFDGDGSVSSLVFWTGFPFSFCDACFPSSWGVAPSFLIMTCLILVFF